MFDSPFFFLIPLFCRRLGEGRFQKDERVTVPDLSFRRPIPLREVFSAFFLRLMIQIGDRFLFRGPPAFIDSFPFSLFLRASRRRFPPL